MAKILILANNDVGLYKFRKELIQELLINNQVYISLPYGEYVGNLKNMGCVFIDTKIDRRGINPFKDIRLLMKYQSIINELNPNLVLTYTVKPNVYGGLISSLNRIDYAVNITGLGTAFNSSRVLKKVTEILYKFSLKKANYVFFENEENKSTFINSHIIHKNQAHTLNGAGVNVNEYSYNKYPPEKSQINILYIGRVMKEKGIDELLEAAQNIKKRYSNVQFNIVGPIEENYLMKLKDFQNKGVINYYGFQNNVKPFIKKAHCLILPSYHEGMANTLLEAGAMGRPLITSNISGCKEAVVDGETGYQTRVKDPIDLYDNICKFLNLSYKEKSDMGLKSREYIISKFDKKDVVRKTIDILELN